MNWVTYFPEIANVHLTKDVGLIPYFMHATGFGSKLVTGKVSGDLPSLKSEVKGLSVEELPYLGRRFFLEKSFIKYLEENASKIDVLNLYHLDRDSIVYGVIYKKQNPNGKLYLKLDAYNSHLKKRKNFSGNPIKRSVLSWYARKFHQAVDLISVENKKGLEIALKTYPEWRGKLIYLPNGCNDQFLQQEFPNKVEKESILLSVGRPGSPDKNYELILKALPFLRLGTWRMRIIGPMTESFQVAWEGAKNEFPLMADKITFLGEIRDRKTLYQEYAKSRVFFLPSRFESFGISFVEALYFGNFLVGHKGMAAYDDICANGKYGTYFTDNDPEVFAAAINRAKAGCAWGGEDIVQHARNNFYWSEITGKLIKELDLG